MFISRKRKIVSLIVCAIILFVSAPFLLGLAFIDGPHTFSGENIPFVGLSEVSLSLEKTLSAETTQSIEDTQAAEATKTTPTGGEDGGQSSFGGGNNNQAPASKGGNPNVSKDENNPSGIGPMTAPFALPAAGEVTTSAAIIPFAAQTSSDLADFLKSVNMYDMSINPPVLVPNGGETILGGNYKFEVTFAESSQLQMQYDSSGYLTFQLPTDLTILNPIEQTPLYSPINGDRIIGWYTISSDGLVEMWFDNVDMSGNPTPGNINLIDYYANVSISLDIFAQLTGGSDGNIDFGGGIIVEIQPPKEPDPSLTMHKASRYVPTAGPGTLPERVEYMLTITALGGPIDNVFVLDAPTIDAGNGSVAFEDNSVFHNFRYYIDGDPRGTVLFTPDWWTTPNFYWSHSFGDLVLEQGQTITIRYYVDLPGLVSLNTGTGQALDGMSEIIYNFFINNTAHVGGQSYADDSSIPPVYDSTTDYVRKDFVLSKGGEYISGTNQIQWSITVGDGKSAILNGGTITDVIDDLLTLAPDSEINIQFIDYGGTVQTFTADNLAITAPPLYERYPVLSGSVNPINGFTLTVPPNAVPWTAFYQVIITYITDINPSDIPQQGEPSVVFGNDIYFQFPDGGPGIEGGAQVPIIADKVNMSKTTSGICGRPDLSPAGPNGELYYVDYTVTIEVPAGLQGQPLYLYDNLGLSGSANVVNIPEFTSISAEGSEVAGTSLQHTSAIRYNYPPTTNAWRMFFGTEDDALSSGWGWQYNEPITLTLEYRSWLDQAAVNNLKAGRQLQNTVYLINGTDAPSLGTLGNAVGSTNVTDLWPIVKSVQRTENPALFNYTVAIKGNYSNRAASLLEGRSPIFADTFDSRLTYVPNSFYMVNTNAPGYYYVHNGDVAVASGGLKAELNDGLWTRYQDQYPDGINPQSATSDWFEADYTYEAHYQLVLGSAYLETAEVISLVNTAAIEVDPGACKFEASQSVNYVESRLSKTMNPLSSGSDLVNVEIIINPDGSIVFSDGVNTPPQTVVASDYLRNLVLFVDSVTFYTQTQDATTGVWDGKWVAISTPPASMNDRTEWSTNPVVPPAPPAGVIADGQVDFVIPNAQPVKITYQVRVTLPPGEMDTISNEIHIFGESAGDSNDNYVVGGGGVGVGGDKLNLRVFKVDQEGASLPDATFSLYVTDIENNIFSPPGGLPVAKTITGSGGETIDFGLVYVAGPNPPALEASVTTDQNGIALFGDNEWLTSDTGFDLLYLLVETGVPAGYMANNENTYFVLNPNIDVGTIDYVETLVEEGIDQATDFVRVENTALGAMTIQKTFEGISDVLINQELQNLQISISGPGNFERTIGLQEILDNPNGILIENLVPGAYSVEETGAEITSLVLSTNPSLPYSYDVEPGSTGEIAVVIINTYTPEAVEPTPVDLRINKIIEGLSESEIAEGLRNLEIVIAGPGINSEVVFNLLDILVGPMVIENAAPGRYAISERNADVAGFSLETSPSLPRIFELLPNDSGYVEFDLYNVYTELPPVPPPPTPTTPTVPITPTVPSPPGDAGKGPITGDMLKGANLALVLLALLAIATSITGLHRLKEGEEENS